MLFDNFQFSIKPFLCPHSKKGDGYLDLPFVRPFEKNCDKGGKMGTSVSYEHIIKSEMFYLYFLKLF